MPTDSRDTLYRKSGQCSVQIRAARLPTDPSETGLEVMRLYGERDLAAVTRAGESIPGWLGAFASNGAFYIRTDDKHIKEARKFWFEADERFDDDNIALKCAKQFRVQGFTAGTTCKDVRATLKAAGWNVVPLRVIHIQELATAIVASDKDPGSWKTASSLGTLLITSEDRKPRKIAATSKGTLLQALRDESKTKNPMPFMASAQPSTAVPLPARPRSILTSSSLCRYGEPDRATRGGDERCPSEHRRSGRRPEEHQCQVAELARFSEHWFFPAVGCDQGHQRRDCFPLVANQAAIPAAQSAAEIGVSTGQFLMLWESFWVSLSPDLMLSLTGFFGLVLLVFPCWCPLCLCASVLLFRLSFLFVRPCSRGGQETTRKGEKPCVLPVFSFMFCLHVS